MIWRLPQFLQPAPKRYGFVFGIGTDGKITHNLQEPKGRFAPVTRVVEARGKLHRGSLSEPTVGILTVARSRDMPRHRHFPASPEALYWTQGITTTGVFG